jgi:hypothetical protein
MTDIDIGMRPVVDSPVQRAPLAALESHQITCVPGTRSVQRLAVLTTGPASSAMVSAVRKMVTRGEIVRFIERDGPASAKCAKGKPANLRSLTPWFEWADVVITDANEESIAEAVEFGFVPVVGMPKKRIGSSAARRARDVVHPWTCRGLAMQLCLAKPVFSLLHCAAGVRTTQRTAPTGVVWKSA